MFVSSYMQYVEVLITLHTGRVIMRIKHGHQCNNMPACVRVHLCLCCPPASTSASFPATLARAGHCDTSQCDVSEMTCNISKPGAEEEYVSSRLEERQPLGKTWKVKIAENFLISDPE